VPNSEAKAKSARAVVTILVSAASASTMILACAQGAFDDGTAGIEQNEDAAVAPLPTKDAGRPAKPDAEVVSNDSDASVVVIPAPKDGGTTTPDTGIVTGTVCTTLLINEFQTSGASAADEFIELYNPGASCSFAGWKLIYRSFNGVSDVKFFEGSITVPAAGYVVLASSTFGGTKAGVLSGGMAADKGQLQLRDPSNAVADSLGYGATTGAFVRVLSAPTPVPGQSIARSPNGATTLNNRTDFKVATAPSPNLPNP
jgi:Lamin Tail Domain